MHFCSCMGPLVLCYPMERIALQPLSVETSTYLFSVTILMVEAYPLPNQEAPTLVKVLVNEWICRYGFPDFSHLDQSKILSPTFFCRSLSPSWNGENLNDTIPSKIRQVWFNWTLLTILNPKRYLGKRVPCADAGLLLEYAGEYPIHSLSTYVPARSPIALWYNIWRWNNSRNV